VKPISRRTDISRVEQSREEVSRVEKRRGENEDECPTGILVEVSVVNVWMCAY